MAGDWIPMRIDLRDDPAVIAIAEATGLDEDTVTGKLLRLWGWANRQLTNGCAPCVTDSWVDRFLSAPGFAAAMLSAGWLATRAGQLIFPKFERWNSQGAKQRVLAAERMRRSRDAKRDGASATKAQPQKRTEEIKEEASASSAGEGDKSPCVRPPRPRNLLFDAVAEVSGLDPATAGETIGVASAKLAKGKPPYTPDEVREFGKRFWELCPWAADKKRTRPTPTEIAKNIGLIRSGPGNVDARPPPPVRRTFRDKTTEYAADTLAGILDEGIDERSSAPRLGAGEKPGRSHPGDC